MSNLADYLQAQEPLFTESLKELEQRSGHIGADVQLLAELATKSAAFVSELGLDNRASAAEIYTTLLKRSADDNATIAKLVGAPDAITLNELIPRLVKLVQNTDFSKDCYSLKESVAAHILRDHPPKQIMQRLGYDSVETLLRHEDIGEIFVALRFAESPEWLNEFNTVYTSMQPSDFEAREIRIVVFDPSKWGDIAEHFVQKKLHNLTHSKEMGVVGVVPMQQPSMIGAPLKILTMLLHYHNEIRLYSAYFKLISTKKNFGEVLSRTLIAGTPDVSIHAGHHIHWRVIQRYFAKLGDESHPEIFQPHVQPEDLHWRAAEDILFDIEPKLGVWRGLDYVATRRGEDIVSLNLIDVAFSYSNGINFENRYTYHFKEALWNELFSRYMGSEVLRAQVLERLDNEIIKPEEL